MSNPVTTDTLQRGAFLRTTRNFPEDLHQLTVEVNQSYTEVASAVNNRTVGFFIANRATVTGENWFVPQQNGVSSQRQQGIREVYSWDDSNLTIQHGLQFLSLSNFVRIWGTFFDGTNWQTLPYVDVTNATNQINVKVNSTNIVITKGGGSPPSCTNGLVILEYIANP